MARDDPLATFSARPTVRIAGEALPLLSANIVRFRMREATGGLSSLELSMSDILSFPDGSAGFGGTAASPVQLGADLAIYAGATDGPQEIFHGIITAIEAEAGPGSAPLFTVLAEDKLYRLRRRRRSRVFEQIGPGEIVKRIASDHGIEVQAGAGLDTPVATWVQMNESDLAFLRRLLGPIDADLQMVGDTLQVFLRAAEPRATRSLRLGDTLLTIRVTADLAEQATEARVGSFDPDSGEPVSAAASSGRMGPGAGSDGPGLYRRLIGEQREHAGDQRTMTSAHGRALAEAAYGQRARGFVRAHGTAQGDAGIRVGSWLTLTGLNPFFVNDYCVTEAVHRFDMEKGYLTDFVAECAFLGAGA